MGRRGFSLLEVLVALAVVAIALASMLRIQGRLVADGAEVEARVLAHWVAANRIAALRLGPAWLGDTARHSGEAEEAGRPFYWRTESFSTSYPGVVRVEVKVSDTPDGESLARMTSFIPAAPEN